MNEQFDDITGITVTFNTKDLFERAYTSVRKFMPNLKMIIIDGSYMGSECYRYVRSLRENEKNVVFQIAANIGHGKGMHFALKQCKTKFALVYDSDIEMLKNPVAEMIEMMTEESYGCGWITQIGRDGYDFGTPGFDQKESISYLHPYFMLLNVKRYFDFKPFVHHGAPCYKAMTDLHDRNEAWRLRSFPPLTGHTSGKGANWTGRPNDYIRHDFGGTRNNNKLHGREEIEGRWQ